MVFWTKLWVSCGAPVEEPKLFHIMDFKWFDILKIGNKYIFIYL
jgi:hypothetical protein